MSDLCDLYLSFVPSWTLPENAHLRCNNVTSFTVNTLQRITQRLSTKPLLVDFLLNEFDSLLCGVTNDVNKYRIICQLYHNRAGPEVYLARLINLFTVNTVARESHVFTTHDFLPALRANISTCSPAEANNLVSALNAKVTSSHGSTQYRLNRSSGTGFMLSTNLPLFLCKVFQDQFTFLYGMSNATLIEFYLSKNWQSDDVKPFYDICDLIFAIGYPYLMPSYMLFTMPCTSMTQTTLRYQTIQILGNGMKEKRLVLVVLLTK